MFGGFATTMYVVMSRPYTKDENRDAIEQVEFLGFSKVSGGGWYFQWYAVDIYYRMVVSVLMSCFLCLQCFFPNFFDRMLTFLTNVCMHQRF